MDTIVGVLEDERGEKVLGFVRFVQIRDKDSSVEKAFRPQEYEVASNNNGSFYAELSAGDYSVFADEARRWIMDIRVPGDSLTHNISDIRIENRFNVQRKNFNVTSSTWTWDHNQNEDQIFLVFDENGKRLLGTYEQNVTKSRIEVNWPFGKKGYILRVPA